MGKVRWQVNWEVISTTDQKQPVTDKIVVDDVILK